jgi:hypothetical protein
MAQQTAINNQLLSFIKSNDHSSVPMGDAADPVALSATATAINEEDEKKQQQRAVRDSRQSLYLHNSNLLSPLAPPLGVRRLDCFLRRSFAMQQWWRPNGRRRRAQGAWLSQGVERKSRLERRDIDRRHFARD